MDEVGADQELSLTVRKVPHRVRIPYFFEE